MTELIGRPEMVRLASGLIVPEEVAIDHYRSGRPRPTCVDLFAGAGGFSVGVTKAGFDVVAAVETWGIAVVTYMMNLSHYGMCEIHCDTEARRDELNNAVLSKKDQKRLARGKVVTMPVAGTGWISKHPELQGCRHMWAWDVRTLTGDMILKPLGLKPGDLDLVVGGPPCQGFSTAGKRDIADPRNTLVFEFARLVCEMQPKTFMMENVPNILKMTTADGEPIMDALARIFEAGNYCGRDALERMLKAQVDGFTGFRARSDDKPKRRDKTTSPPAASESLPLFDTEAGEVSVG